MEKNAKKPDLKKAVVVLGVGAGSGKGRRTEDENGHSGRPKNVKK